MKREYTTGTASGVNMFIGEEIEQTIFVSRTTLFVSDPDTDIKEIVKNYEMYDCEHVYLGANHSITSTNLHKWVELASWLVNTYKSFTTIDLDVILYKQISTLLHSYSLADSDLFCLTVSCKLPYADSIKNLYIKVDDVDFNATNTGVWVHNAKQPNTFTPWEKYGKDIIINE